MLSSVTLNCQVNLKMYIPQPCARRVHRNCPTYMHPPSVGMIYPIPTYMFNWHIFSKLLAANIRYKYIFLKMYSPQPCTQRAQRNSPTYIHHPSVGRIYEQYQHIYSTDIYFSNCWQKLCKIVQNWQNRDKFAKSCNLCKIVQNVQNRANCAKIVQNVQNVQNVQICA